MIIDSGNDTKRNTQSDGKKNENGASHALAVQNFSRRTRFSTTKRSQIIAESFENGANIAAVVYSHGIEMESENWTGS